MQRVETIGSAAGETSAAPGEYGFGGRGAFILGLLMLINVINFIDRQLPFILIGAIKADLKLTDSQIGLMAGLAFAIVYSFAALPLAHIADRYSPRWVLTITLATWSVMTAVSGLANNFFQLVLGRIGVAASEAGCTPAAHAFISRLFAADRRAMALAIFSLGVPIGSTAGLMLGGWINDIASWRVAFFVVGLPGLVIALISLLALPRLPQAVTVRTKQDSFFVGLRELFRLPSFRYMAAGSSLFACGSYAMNVFAPAFLMRVHGLTAAQAGVGLGIAFGLGGLIGTFAGGALGDWLGRKDEAWRQHIPAIGQWLSIPSALGAWLIPNTTLSIVCLTLTYLFGLLYFAPTFAAAQSLVRDSSRATASAVLLFCLTLVGSSVGPVVVGRISDALIPSLGNLSLRYAMCSMVVTMALSAICYHLAGRTLPADLNRSR